MSGDDSGSSAAAGLVRLLAATVEVMADCDALLDAPAVPTADVLTRAAAGGGAVPTDC